MKILALIGSERINGVKFHRIIYPMSALTEFYEDVEVDVSSDISTIKKEDLEKYDIALGHTSEITPQQVKELRLAGVKVVLDVDDYWVLTEDQDIYKIWKENKYDEKVVELLKSDVFISTTSLKLAKIIRKMTEGTVIEVLPNGFVAEAELLAPIKTEGFHFGWIGAGNHTADLKLIKDMKKAYGFNVGVLDGYEKVFGDKFDYYRTMSVPDYLNLYNIFDAILIPLVESKFNGLKSELKLIEAGYYKKPVVVSGVEPYLPYLRDGENCLIANTRKEWQVAMKALKNDPELCERLGNTLNSDMAKHFDLKEITKKRYKFYKKILKNV